MKTTRWRETRLTWAAASLVTVIIAASALLTACGDEQLSPTAMPILTPPPASTTPPATDTATSSGQAIFQSNCAVCHGAGGEGQPDWHIKKPDGALPAPPLNGDGHT